MKKISDIKNKKDLNYELVTSYNNSLKDECFKEFVSKINLSDTILMKYTSKIEESLKEYENCKSCKGLIMCKNSMNGFCFLPRINGDRLDFLYKSCRYKNKYDSLMKYQNNINYFDVPKEIKEAKIKDIFTDDNSRKDVIKMILNYVKDYKKGIINKGFYLHGNFGCGKTYLLSAMINELSKEKVKSSIIYWPEYLRSLKQSFQSSINDEFKVKYNEVKYSNILLIDDLGAETVTNWSRDEILGTILQYRMQENLPTFITSNLTLKELEEHLSLTNSNKTEKVKSKRIIERIMQLTTDVEMIGENKRK